MSPTLIVAGPASFIQRSMWAIAQRHRAVPFNVIALPWRVRGALDADRLAAALTDVVDRHPALRTRLVMVGGQLMQAVAATEPLAPMPTDVGGATSECRLNAALALLRDATRMPINIVAGPPLRALWLRLDADDHVLALIVHHAVCDGWSRQIIVDDLVAFYAARLRGEPARLAPLSMSVVDHAQEQIETADRGGYAAELAYWRDELDGLAPPVALPVVAPRKGHRDFRAAAPRSLHDAQTLAALQARARGRRVSTFALLLASLAVLLHQRSGSEDIVIGVPTLGRWSPQAMTFVGCATNMLPARIRIDPAHSFDELAAAVHATIRRLLAYGRVPLELVLREIQHPMLSRPGFPVWSQLLATPPAVMVAGSTTTFAPLPVERGALLSEIDIDMLESAAGLQCEFAHRPALFGAEIMQGLMAGWSVLTATLANGGSPHVEQLSSRLTPPPATHVT